LLIGLLLSGCSGQGASPEEQIMALLERAETAVENRSLSDAAELISPAYRDQAGRDRRGLKQLLLGYFLRNQSIHVLKQVRRIDLQEADRARVVLFAGVAGQRPGEATSLQQWRGDLVRLEAELILDDGEWRLVAASWRRASQGDLL
jgi:hypothetical protein